MKIEHETIPNLPLSPTLLEFVEMCLEEQGVTLQPFQRDLLQRLEMFQEEMHRMKVSTSVEIQYPTKQISLHSVPPSRKPRVALVGHKVVAVRDPEEDSSGSTFLTMTVGLQH
jgi:hypothetical protein